MMKITNIN